MAGIIITEIGRYDIICTKGNRTYQNRHEANNVYDFYIDENVQRYGNSTHREKTRITQSIITSLQSPADESSPRYRFVQPIDGTTAPFVQYQLLSNIQVRERVAHALRTKYRKYQQQQQQQLPIEHQPRLVTDQGTAPVVTTGNVVHVTNFVDLTANRITVSVDSRSVTPEIAPGSPLRDELFQILLEHFDTPNNDDYININDNVDPLWQEQSHIGNTTQFLTNEYTMLDPHQGGQEDSSDEAYDIHESMVRIENHIPYDYLDSAPNNNNTNDNCNTRTSDPEPPSLTADCDGERYDRCELSHENNESNNINLNTQSSWLEQTCAQPVHSVDAADIGDELYDILASISDENESEYDVTDQHLRQNPPVRIVSNDEDERTQESIIIYRNNNNNNNNSDISNDSFQTHQSQVVFRTDNDNNPDAVDFHVVAQNNDYEIIPGQLDTVARGGAFRILQQNINTYDDTAIYSPVDKIISHPNDHDTILIDQVHQSQQSLSRMYINDGDGDYGIDCDRILEIIWGRRLLDVNLDHCWREEESLHVQRHHRSTARSTHRTFRGIKERDGIAGKMQHNSNYYTITECSTVDEVISYPNNHFNNPTILLSVALYPNRIVNRSTSQPNKFLLLAPTNLTVSDWEYSAVQIKATTTFDDCPILQLLLLLIIMIQIPMRRIFFQTNAGNDHDSSATKPLVSSLGN